MMKRALLCGLVIGALLAAAAVGIARATSSDISHPVTIRLVEKDITDSFQDQVKKGFGPGDEIFTYGKLMRPSGRRVGTFASSCTLVSKVSVGTGFCVLNAKLPKGKVTFQGIVSFNSTTFVLAVNGGTATYQNARGQVTITGTDQPTSHFTFELIP